jgi:hypothetical protein
MQLKNHSWFLIRKELDKRKSTLLNKYKVANSYSRKLNRDVWMKSLRRKIKKRKKYSLKMNSSYFTNQINHRITNSSKKSILPFIETKVVKNFALYLKFFYKKHKLDKLRRLRKQYFKNWHSKKNPKFVLLKRETFKYTFRKIDRYKHNPG